MNPQTEAAYRAWRIAANRGYGVGRLEAKRPDEMRRIDARIRRLKARYEQALTIEKGR